MKSKIKVAIVGCGNCAKSLIEGVSYYQQQPDMPGLMYQNIGGYTADDIEFVTAYDIDPRKVGLPLEEAIRKKPNCAMEIESSPEEVCNNAIVQMGSVLDGVADHMLEWPEEVSFRIADLPEPSLQEVADHLKEKEVKILINYLPVGSELASEFYISAALEAGINVINCIPTFISTKAATKLEQRFIDKGLVIIGSDMRSGVGASRVSEVLQSLFLDSGAKVTQHIQTNMAAGCSQGQEYIQTGSWCNTDFGNMAAEHRLRNKHISKENVIRGQNKVREVSLSGNTLYAGPSLAVTQIYNDTAALRGTDKKIANFDIIAYGFGGARYELTARLSCEDSANSGNVVISAIRFCQVASELGIVGYLRGASAWINKSPPVQMKTEEAKYECDALARRELTDSTIAQLKENNPKATDLKHSFNDSDKD